MSTRNQYDLIAIGDEAGALLSAILAARAGFSVLIVPQSMGISYPSGLIVGAGDQIFDPEPNVVGGVVAFDKFRAPVEDLLKRVGLLEGEWEAFQFDRRGVELATDSVRLRLGEGYRELIRELKREWGGEPKEWSSVQGVLKAMEELNLSHWGRSAHRLTLRRSQEEIKKSNAEYLERTWRRARRRTLSNASSGISESRGERSVQALLAALASIHHQSTADPSEIYETLALLGMEAPFRGGMSAWRAQLLRLARRLGAEVSPKNEVKHIWVRRGKFLGVQMGTRSAVIEGRCGVLGIPLDMARKRILHSGIGSFRMLKAPLKPQGWRFTIAMTVRKEAIPAELPSRTVVAEMGAPALEIETAFPGDYGVNASEYRVIFLRTVLPMDAETLRLEYQRRMAARMVRRVSEVFPFLEFHVGHIYPDFRLSAEQRRQLGVLASENSIQEERHELGSVYGNWTQLDQIPEVLRVYSDPGHGIHSGIGHLFLTGKEAFPHLGNFGSSWAAMEVTQWLAQKSGMHSILLGEKKGET